jgi:site-specific recombinase XerD
MTPLPLAECIEKFLDDLSNARTISTYRGSLNRFVEFAGRRPWPDLLSAAVLVDYWRWLRRKRPAGMWQKDSRQLSAQTIKAYLAAAISLLDYLSAADRLPVGFSLAQAKAKLRHAMKKNKQPYPIRTADPRLPLVIAHYDRIALPSGERPRERRARLILLRNRAVVHVLYATAGRVSEVAQLNRDSANGLTSTVPITGKGGQERVLHLTSEARAAIRAYLAERDDDEAALFIGHRRTGRLGKNSLWAIVKSAALAEGLADLHPHDFRHYRAEQLLHEGMDIEVLQAYLGHADISTTRRIYAPHTSSHKVADQLQTFGRTPQEALSEAVRQGLLTER